MQGAGQQFIDRMPFVLLKVIDAGVNGLLDSYDNWDGCHDDKRGTMWWGRPETHTREHMHFDPERFFHGDGSRNSRSEPPRTRYNTARLNRQK